MVRTAARNLSLMIFQGSSECANENLKHNLEFTCLEESKLVLSAVTSPPWNAPHTLFVVNDPSLQTFVRETAAADFFTALVKATGKQSLRLNQALLEEEQYVMGRLMDASALMARACSGLATGLIAEHLDTFQYMNDILQMSHLALPQVSGLANACLQAYLNSRRAGPVDASAVRAGFFDPAPVLRKLVSTRLGGRQTRGPHTTRECCSINQGWKTESVNVCAMPGAADAASGHVPTSTSYQRV